MTFSDSHSNSHLEFLLTCLLRGMTTVRESFHLSVSFLLTCLLRGMTWVANSLFNFTNISTHMPLARHDGFTWQQIRKESISTHMPLARHDPVPNLLSDDSTISTHMPLARHDSHAQYTDWDDRISTHMPLARHDLVPCRQFHQRNNFYSHASCEAWLN